VHGASSATRGRVVERGVRKKANPLEATSVYRLTGLDMLRRSPEACSTLGQRFGRQVARRSAVAAVRGMLYREAERHDLKMMRIRVPVT